MERVEENFHTAERLKFLKGASMEFAEPFLKLLKDTERDSFKSNRLLIRARFINNSLIESSKSKELSSFVAAHFIPTNTLNPGIKDLETAFRFEVISNQELGQVLLRTSRNFLQKIGVSVAMLQPKYSKSRYPNLVMDLELLIEGGFRVREKEADSILVALKAENNNPVAQAIRVFFQKVIGNNHFPKDAHMEEWRRIRDEVITHALSPFNAKKEKKYIGPKNDKKL